MDHAGAATPPSPAIHWHAWARLILAVAATTLLTLGWGRTVIMSMLLGAPEWQVATISLAVFVLICLLTWRLRPAFTTSSSWTQLDTRVATGLMLLWCGAYAGLFVWYIVAFVPLWQIYAVFVPSTFWVLFASWFGWWPARLALKLGLLAMLLLLAVDFPLLVTVIGLAGDSSVNLGWRLPDRVDRPAKRRVQSRPSPSSAARAVLPPLTTTDFARYLGPNGNAMLPSAKVTGDWKVQAPKQRWRVPLGEGWGSFAIVGEFCFTQLQDGDDECVVCLELHTGNEVWRHADTVRFAASMGGPGPRATPTFAEGKLFSVGAGGLLNCLDAANGHLLWHVDLMADNGVTKNLEHGVCASPLVYGGKVYVSPPGEDGKSLVAYDAGSGKRLWQAGQHRASYSSPMFAELAGVPQILVFHANGVTAHAPDDGSVLWSHPWNNSVHVNVSQPLIIQNNRQEAMVLLSTGYDKGSTLLQISRPASGAWLVKTMWESRELKTKFTTAVLFDGYVYGLDDGILCCMDPKTGKRNWKAGRYNHGQILLAGDRIIVQAEDGSVALVEPNPKELIERGRIRALSSKTWNHPALAGRMLLVRNDQEAVCYELP